MIFDLTLGDVRSGASIGLHGEIMYVLPLFRRRQL